MLSTNRILNKKSWKRGLCASLPGLFLLGMVQSATAEPLPEPTEIGAIIRGTLDAATDSVIAAFDSRLTAGQYADAYTFTGAVGQQVMIEIASDDFDSVLWLFNSRGEFITADDDSGDALGSLLNSFTLPETDTYTLLASSHGAGETGEYTLRLNEAPIIASPIQLNVDEAVQGSIKRKDDSLDTGQHYDAYSFAAEHGKIYSILMSSGQFDCSVRVMNEEGKTVALNDTSQRIGKKQTISEIVFLPPASGSYTILAGSDEEKASGRYTLQVTSAVTPKDSQKLAGTVEGSLDAFDKQLPSGQYFDVYSFAGEAGETIALELKSSGFDSYLRLLDENGNILTQDDDSGDGKDALINSFTLPETGEYYVWASSVFAGSQADYELTLDTAAEMQTTSMAAEASTADETPSITIFLGGSDNSGFTDNAAGVIAQGGPQNPPDNGKGEDLTGPLQAGIQHPIKVHICGQPGEFGNVLVGLLPVDPLHDIVLSCQNVTGTLCGYAPDPIAIPYAITPASPPHPYPAECPGCSTLHCETVTGVDILGDVGDKKFIAELPGASPGSCLRDEEDMTFIP